MGDESVVVGARSSEGVRSRFGNAGFGLERLLGSGVKLGVEVRIIKMVCRRASERRLYSFDLALGLEGWIPFGSDVLIPDKLLRASV